MSDSDDLLKQAVEEIEKLREEIEQLKLENQRLSTLAEEGKACRIEHVKKWIEMKVQLGDVAANEFDMRKAMMMAKSFPMKYLMYEIGILEKRLRETHIKRRIANARNYNWSRLHDFF